jgi:hypothetical protein
VGDRRILSARLRLVPAAAAVHVIRGTC